MTNSDFFNLNWKDIGHGFVNAVLTTIFTTLGAMIMQGKFPTDWGTISFILLAGLSAGIGYFTSKLPQNASGSYGTLPTGTTVTTPATKTTVS